MSKKKRLGSDPLERLKDNIIKDVYSDASILIPNLESKNETISKPTDKKKSLTEKITIDKDITNNKPREKIKKDFVGGKFLTFFLAGTEYGFRINNVIEIIGLMDIRSIPRMPDFIKGMINLRGNIIPAMDLRLKLGIEPKEYTKESVIIIVKVNNYKMGIIVDRISGVSDIADKDIVSSPEFGPDINTDYILCLGKSEGKVKFFLNIEKLVFTEELEQGITNYGKR